MPASTREQDSADNLRSMQAAMERLERREWWRWATALVIMLLLTLGVLSLSVAGPEKEIFTQYQFDLAVPGLFALVLVFDVFAIYQQILISRLRRQLSGQMAMLATLEAVRPQEQADSQGRRERRRVQRTPLDQRIKVIATTRGKETVLHGRVIDLSELGLAAVLSGSLERAEKVLLEFSPGGNSVMTLSATIRYAQGFRHGFEFSNVRPVELEQLRRACMGAKHLNVRRVEARASSLGSE
jgi:hypothetical protein